MYADVEEVITDGYREPMQTLPRLITAICSHSIGHICLTTRKYGWNTFLAMEEKFEKSEHLAGRSDGQFSGGMADRN